MQYKEFLLEVDMKKKIILLTLIVILTMCSCGVDSTGSAYTEHIYIDKKTGVNYIWINTNSGVTMCPRYKADGSLYIKK